MQCKPTHIARGSCCSGARVKSPPCITLRRVEARASALPTTTCAPPRVGSGSTQYPPWLPPIVSEITDKDALYYAKQMRRVPVQLPSLPQEPLRTAVLGPSSEELDAWDPSRQQPVVVLLHSFDSNSLEWRRLIPRMEASFQQQAGATDSSLHSSNGSANGNGVPPAASSTSSGAKTGRVGGWPLVAIDLVGWGFTDHAAWRRNPNLPVSPALKREHLQCFREQHLGGRPLVLVGTSLGGTMAVDFALAYPEAVTRLVLLDAQGFSSGVTPLPRPLAMLGVMVLKAIWLRKAANQMAYFDKATFAVDDAWRVGRLGTHFPGWLEANVAFIQSGGFNLPEERIKQVTQRTLLLWGDKDEILPPAMAQQWEKAMGPDRCKVVMVPDSGHSPHIEKADFVAQTMVQWLQAELH